MTTSELQDYIPEEEWPPVSTMLDGFGDQTLPASDALSGTTLRIEVNSHQVTEYVFHDATSLTWSGPATDGSATYKAIEARPGIFIIDVVRGQHSGQKSDADNVTMVFDRTTGALTLAVSGFVSRDGKVRSTTEFTHVNVGGVRDSVHERSSALVGKRIFYRYSDIETYEHIYLNQGTFTWHCIRGGESGLADTDRCMTWAVAEDLYIFFWTEKVMTVEAVLLIDLREQRSIGRMFGWDDPAAEPVILPFNSRLSVLNTTTYPLDTNKH